MKFVAIGWIVGMIVKTVMIGKRNMKKMNNIHINNSYNIWNTSYIRFIIKNKCYENFNSYEPEIVLNRTYRSMYIEWWLHNIGYYITKPFYFIKKISEINLRCKDVDLEEWIKV